MNIITIHTSHDGSITISKNGNLIVHAQIDRFNNIIASSQPSIKLLLSIKELNIKFDLVYFSFLMESCHGFWIELLKKYNLLKNTIFAITEARLKKNFQPRPCLIFSICETGSHKWKNNA